MSTIGPPGLTKHGIVELLSLPRHPIETRRAMRSRQPRGGQSLVEFALLLPLLLLLAIAVADFGRLFTSMIAVESAAREAADYGAMQGKIKWDTGDAAQITQNGLDMRARACAAASSLSDYVGDPPGTVDMTCSNPSFAFTYNVERVPSSGNCSTQGEFEAPCIIHVTLTYQFRMFLNFAPLPGVINVTRDSRFAISDLGS